MRDNIQRALEKGWKVQKVSLPSKGYFAVKGDGTKHNEITKVCTTEADAAFEALNVDYEFHQKKEYHVWLETVDPSKGGKQGGDFIKVSPPLSSVTAAIIEKLYRIEHPDKSFCVSIGKPRSYSL
jgi:hypothetical protein